MIYPRLYKKDSKGKIRFWEIQLVADMVTMDVLKQTTTGIVDESAKVNNKRIKDSKTAKAMPRAQKLCTTEFNKKLRLGYFETIELARTTEPPKAKMLVKDMLPSDIMKMDKEEFPIFMQEKLNGVAGTYHHDKGEILSRDLKVFDRIPHIVEACRVHCVENGLPILDFEIFAPGFKINEIVHLVKCKVGSDDNKKLLKAWIFDLPSDQKFSHRNHIMRDVSRSVQRYEGVSYLFTHMAKNREEVWNFYEDVTENDDGEGIILRTFDGLYKWNNKTTRDNRIRKVKPILSEEFKIIGVTYESRIVASETKQLIEFMCETHDGKHQFKVPPTSWGVEERVQVFHDFKAGVLKIKDLAPLTINFREWTSTMKPFHILDTILRDYES